MSQFDPFDVFEKRRFFYPVICPDEADGTPSEVFSEAVRRHTTPSVRRRWAREEEPRPVPVDYRAYRRHALEVGAARQRVMETKGRQEDNLTRFTTEQIHQMACCGEVAVALFLGLDPTEQVVCLEDIDDGADLRLPHGHAVQVKSHARARCDYIAHKRPMPSDFGFVVWLVGRGRALIPGWLTARDFERWALWREDLPRPAHFVAWQRLRDVRRWPL